MTREEIIEMVRLIDKQLENKEELDEPTEKLLIKLRAWWAEKL